MNTTTEALYSIYLKHPSVFTDTRMPVRGGIFFALSGPNFNGNRFIRSALDAGAAFAVSDEVPENPDSRVLQVNDTLKALQDLALYHRRQLTCKVIAITGSNGKTTTKELVAAVLSRRFKTSFTQGNLNNHIGVPLTLLNIGTDIQMAVIEMGANKPGDIKELCEIAEPDYGLITNIGKAHLEGMGGYEGIVQTKTELYRFIGSHGGRLFVNTNHQVFLTRSMGITAYKFGAAPDNDVYGLFIDASPYVRFSWAAKGEDVQMTSVVETRLIGYYNFENILAAAAIGHFFGVSANDINEAVSTYIPDNNRSQVINTGNNILILDAYNANPTSMEAAISNFRAMNAGKKMIILGKMMELGETSAEEHQRIARMAAESEGVETILVGDLYKVIPSGIQHFQTTSELLEWLKDRQFKDYTILIKGSRANQLEQIKGSF
jgi:UDP-N-acetylmuramoyl-tripeptide--D-alanyl-D-alanine ligase